MCALRA